MPSAALALTALVLWTETATPSSVHDSNDDALSHVDQELNELKTMAQLEEQTHHALMEGNVPLRFAIDFFGDTTLWARSSDPSVPPRFVLGALGLMFHADLGSSFSAMGEVAMEGNENNDTEVDVE